MRCHASADSSSAVRRRGNSGFEIAGGTIENAVANPYKKAAARDGNPDSATVIFIAYASTFPNTKHHTAEPAGIFAAKCRTHNILRYSVRFSHIPLRLGANEDKVRISKKTARKGATCERHELFTGPTLHRNSRWLRRKLCRAPHPVKQLIANSII